MFIGVYNSARRDATSKVEHCRCACYTVLNIFLKGRQRERKSRRQWKAKLLAVASANGCTVGRWRERQNVEKGKGKLSARVVQLPDPALRSSEITNIDKSQTSCRRLSFTHFPLPMVSVLTWLCCTHQRAFGYTQVSCLFIQSIALCTVQALTPAPRPPFLRTTGSPSNMGPMGEHMRLLLRSVLCWRNPIRVLRRT